ncbi:zinc-dependent metalloprotease [Aureivirga sp. CE67]|uniref:zinc-dependent metalloprotease n=1 Tax=Aureivirga sp. CE67 TaxID=1788983 RepID=UPI0018C95AB5|nr:zinc-dependent metalloprotease [Aureivirga sp. CE67]
MAITLSRKLLFIALACGVVFTADAQRKRKRKRHKGDIEIVQGKEKKNAKKGGMKSYEEVITEDADSDHGMFAVHKVEDNYFYEIPDSLFNREMLIVSRIAKTADGIGFGGGKINTQVLRWEKQDDKRVLLRVVSYNNYAADSLPIHQAVVNSNFEPILYNFPIEAVSKDSTGVVINATGLYAKDVKALSLPKEIREDYKISSLDPERSFIKRISSYPQNIEVRTIKTFNSAKPPSNASTGSVTVEISNSMILLPEVPMKRRYFDERVGWFTSSQIDYGAKAQKSKRITYLDRWRLEVKDEDIEKFKRGELVEPKKQIVYYIDRATPEVWKKYIKQGVEDWQKAFEAAGFKNAIIAKDPPTPEEDPEWSPEDVRYSVVRYLASPIPNANGPHVSDPRSGEILESDINWYHNVMTLLHNWFFIQTAAINPEARSNEFKDEVMGRLIRFVSSHEVGHTLGLPHNMASSYAYPVDSLRSAEFTKKFGTAPSIMDYARFNYVAQPEDKGVALMPEIGVYDKYSISWGYRPILDAKTGKDEKETLDAWILEHAGDPMYRFGKQQFSWIVDPTAQTEDLGNDAVKASQYGIANLKRIVPNLIDWTGEKGEDYDNLKDMYGQLIGQYNRYMGHVSSNIGGVYEYTKTYDQKGPVYVITPEKHQEACMKFINDELFKTPEWLLDDNILDRIESAGAVDRIRKTQVRTLNNILDFGRMARLIEAETLKGKEAYSILEMMDDLRNGIWTEIKYGRKIDTYRRNLQRAYLDRMSYLMNNEQKPLEGFWRFYANVTSVNVSQSDIRPVVRGELVRLRKDVKRAINITSDRMSKYHLMDVVERIDEILNAKVTIQE